MIGNQKAARRYARALFDLAVEQGRLDAVQADLDAVDALARAEAGLAAFLGNFSIGQDRRIQVLGALFEGKIDPLAFRFLVFLEAKRRLPLLPDIALALRGLADEQRGILKVTIRSAQPLAADAQAALLAQLERKFGRTIKAEMEIDGSLLGGFQVRVGDRVYDYSIETQLQALQRKLAFA